jgi:hypothetical protein
MLPIPSDAQMFPQSQFLHRQDRDGVRGLRLRVGSVIGDQDQRWDYHWDIEGQHEIVHD